MKIPEHWTFKDKEVAKCFDKHVNEQLPWYKLATEAVTHVCRHYLPTNGKVYDIGASTGNIGRAIEPVLSERKAKLIAIEESVEMATEYEAVGQLIVGKAEEHKYEEFDVAILFLVLMFIPPIKRARLLTQLKKKLRTGGAIIIFDKVEAPEGYFGTVLRRLTMAWKLQNGATAEDIVKKELSLSGVQRPIKDELLGNKAKRFFTFGEFAGWIIEKN